jgi:hypothetical protein
MRPWHACINTHQTKATPKTPTQNRHRVCIWVVTHVPVGLSGASATPNTMATGTPQPLRDLQDLLTTSKQRTDGRDLFEGRPVTVDIAPDDSSVTVAFGETRVFASLRAELQEVRGASKDGRLVIDVKFSPMASTAFEAV